MATKSTKPVEPSVQDAPAVEAAAEVALREWCASTSQTDRRVEMLNAFHNIETRAGRVKAAPDVFAARYAEFANRPL